MTILRRVLEERWLLYIGLFGLAVGLPLSRSFVSIAPGVIFGAWFFDGLYRNDLLDKWKSFTKDRVAVWTTGLFVVYLSWSLFSSNDVKALRLIIDKLPLLLLPIAFSGLELPSRGAIKKLFNIHIMAIVISTVISFVNWKINGADGEIRDSMLFVNHIRLSLMMILAIVFMFFSSRSKWNKEVIAKAMISLWFIFFMYEFQLATGFGLLMVILLISGLRELTRKGGSKLIGMSVLGLLAYCSVLVIPQAKKQFQKPVIPSEMAKEVTAEGRAYYALPDNLQLENGHYVWHYIQLEEMRREWNKRSDRKIADQDDIADLFVGAMIRYLTSKGLRKDAEGVKQLTDEDIHNIEKGHTSVMDSQTSGLKKRIATLFFELDSYFYGGNPSLSSLTVKFEYWKTGLRILDRSIWTGVGVGDLRDEFDAEYLKGTALKRDAWDKTHNQYLTWAITFGLVGGFLALLCFVMPYFSISGEFKFLVTLVFLIFLTSFLMEDTLETQLGLNLYLFYLGMLIMPSNYLPSTSR